MSSEGFSVYANKSKNLIIPTSCPVIVNGSRIDWVETYDEFLKFSDSIYHGDDYYDWCILINDLMSLLMYDFEGSRYRYRSIYEAKRLLFAYIRYLSNSYCVRTIASSALGFTYDNYKDFYATLNDIYLYVDDLHYMGNFKYISVYKLKYKHSEDIILNYGINKTYAYMLGKNTNIIEDVLEILKKSSVMDIALKICN
jgi:hypothetical protein